MGVSETRISRDPIFFSSRGILTAQSVTFEKGQILDRANLLAKLRYFGFLFVLQPMYAFSLPCGVTTTRELQTRSASSTVPCTMLVQVRCMTVSTPYSLCVNEARSSVRSLVDPPAPHVILIARGFRSAKREIRRRRLLKPCIRVALHKIRDHVLIDLAYLFSSRWEELEGIERPLRLFELLRKLHTEPTKEVRGWQCTVEESQKVGRLSSSLVQYHGSQLTRIKKRTRPGTESRGAHRN